MEKKFLAKLEENRKQAEALGIRIRPVTELAQAKRILSGHRESDGFSRLAEKKRLELTLEALAVKQPFTGLFTDEEANNALTRLLEAGYGFR